jgi:hypothetical protein
VGFSALPWLTIGQLYARLASPAPATNPTTQRLDSAQLVLKPPATPGFNSTTAQKVSAGPPKGVKQAANYTLTSALSLRFERYQ